MCVLLASQVDQGFQSGSLWYDIFSSLFVWQRPSGCGGRQMSEAALSPALILQCTAGKLQCGDGIAKFEAEKGFLFSLDITDSDQQTC